MRKQFLLAVWEKCTKGLAIRTALLLLTILVLEIGLTVYIPEWKRTFYDAIEKKQVVEFGHGLLMFLGTMGFLTLTQSLKGFVACRLGLNFRTSITKILLKLWAKKSDHGAYNNPAQRVNEDAKLCTDNTFVVIAEVIISGGIVFFLIAHNINHGMLIAAAILYTLSVSGGAYFFNKPMKTADLALQQAEANHRMSLAKLSLNMGDFTAKPNYLEVVTNYSKYVSVTTWFYLFKSFQNNISVLVPFILLVPSYFTGHGTFGSIMEGVAIFELLVVNGTILLSLYLQVVKAQAGLHRLEEFYGELLQKGNDQHE